ncbi:MAG: hypothetical protein JO257_36535 [Deltaproteobacteria bacterium]|nr:hypothetical protein [Deltaproteobacteria bacterium]
MRRLLLLALAACSSKHPTAPTAKVVAVAPDQMCVTHGVVQGSVVSDPEVRAVSTTSGGDAASLTFKMHDWPTETKALRSGDVRHQLGLKLRAADGCNLVYVMWRLDPPKPSVEVQVKSNPGAATNDECGTSGYTRVKPDHRGKIPYASPGEQHTLQAQIDGDALTAWVDGAVAWTGELPAIARDLKGPAGIRSDNLAYEIVTFAASPGHGQIPCKSQQQATR